MGDREENTAATSRDIRRVSAALNLVAIPSYVNLGCYPGGWGESGDPVDDVDYMRAPIA